jgi:hypothetical protein
VKNRFVLLTTKPVGGTLQETAAYFREEETRWKMPPHRLT